MKRELILLIGVIGSGKSQLSKALDALTVSDDAIIFMLHKGSYTGELWSVYDAATISVVRAALHRYSVAVDSGRLTSVKRREPYIQLARALNVPCGVYVFPVTSAEEHAKRRFEHDPRGVPFDRWLRVAEYQLEVWNQPTI